MDDSQPPLNWNQDQIPEVVAHHEDRTADEPVAEIEAARRAPRPRRRLQLNAQGQLIPPTAAEHAAITEGIKKMIERIREIPDTPGEDDRDFFRAMDSLRPDCPLFEGLY